MTVRSLRRMIEEGVSGDPDLHERAFELGCAVARLVLDRAASDEGAALAAMIACADVLARVGVDPREAGMALREMVEVEREIEAELARAAPN